MPLPDPRLANYVDTIWDRDPADGKAIPMADVQISVYKILEDGSRDTTENTEIFTGRDGGVERTNPFVTDVTGLIDFWAATENDYDVEAVDTIVPARIGTTFWGWQPGAIVIPEVVFPPDPDKVTEFVKAWALSGIIRAENYMDYYLSPYIHYDTLAAQEWKLKAIVYALANGSSTNWVKFKMSLDNADIAGYGTTAAPLQTAADTGPHVVDGGDVVLNHLDTIRPIVLSYNGDPRNLTIGLVLEATV